MLGVPSGFLPGGGGGLYKFRFSFCTNLKKDPPNLRPNLRGGCCVHAKLPGLGQRFFKERIGGTQCRSQHPSVSQNGPPVGCLRESQRKPTISGDKYLRTPIVGVKRQLYEWREGATKNQLDLS